MSRRSGVLWLVLLVVTSILVGCCGPTVTAEPVPTHLVAGKIAFAGSTTLQPLAHELGQAFNERYPDVELDIAAGGSIVGIQAVREGTVDIGMVSRALEADEAEGIEQHPVAIDVIAVVVHISNPVENLTQEQLGDIYLGQIANWREVGGDDRPIAVIVRGKNSGTRGAFDEIVLEKQAPAAAEIRTALTAGDMAVTVIENPGAIGYVGFGNLEPELKTVSINGVLPSEETARDGSYRLVRPLLFLAGPLTQPMAQTFIDFALCSEGQEVVEQSGWVPAR